MTWVALALAGGIGAVVRDRAADALHGRYHGVLVATVLVNLSGALTLGVVTGSGAGSTVTAVLGTGLLGGLTTFSTWMTQAATTAERAIRVAFVAGQLVAGPALAALGLVLGRAL